MVLPVIDHGLLTIMAFLLVFGGISFGLASLQARKFNRTKSGLLVANRSLGFWEASFSVAASWIWAPALFVSGQIAYQKGLIGFLWFLVPNVSCLIVFAWFARRVRREWSGEFTLSGLIAKRTSERVQALYWFTLTGLTVCATAMQLLAGGQFLARITGFGHFQMTLVLAAVPFSYSYFFGLKASVTTDLAKMIFIFIIGFTLIPWVIDLSGGPGVIWRGLPGQIHNLDFFSADSATIFLTFGLPTTIGLLSGPFGDQTFWQRTFATPERYVMRAFLTGAFLFALVPLLMSVLGFLASGAEISILDPQMVNLEVVRHFLPAWANVAFVFMILAGIVSILDSKLAAISSIGGHDWVNRWFRRTSLPFPEVARGARMSMVALLVAGIAIANIPGLKILHLFLFYGTLRSATLLPTILIILGVKVDERAIFWGILCAVTIGFPVFAFGNFLSRSPLVIAGSLLTLLTPAFSVFLFDKVAKQESVDRGR